MYITVQILLNGVVETRDYYLPVTRLNEWRATSFKSTK